ncbi:MAG: CDP-alcohol phosphatidyltransferase family protein [archaeon]|nr:CDP-alcohol phosphatidyltransferase family protein [Nanoarchaeota archaeon]
MDKFRKWLVRGTRKIRDKYMMPIAKLFLKLKIHPNLMTTISLLTGLAAAYFLFTNYIAFVVLVLVHLFSDGLDGVMARAAGKETTFGKYYDLISDRLVNLAMLIKIAFFLQDYYVVLVITFFLLTQALYFGSRRQLPVIFSRTTCVLILVLGYWMGPVIIATLAYLTVGVLSLYSLIMQFNYMIARVRMSKEK